MEDDSRADDVLAHDSPPLHEAQVPLQSHPHAKPEPGKYSLRRKAQGKKMSQKKSVSQKKRRSVGLVLLSLVCLWGLQVVSAS